MQQIVVAGNESASGVFCVNRDVERRVTVGGSRSNYGQHWHREYPRRAYVTGVVNASCYGCVRRIRCRGYRNRESQISPARSTTAKQRGALLSPDAAGADKHQDPTGRCVQPAQCDVSVDRQRHRLAHSGRARTGGDELLLLRPDAGRECEYPYRAGIAVVRYPPTEAVAPSPDNATEMPWLAPPTAPAPTNLLPC